ncbi:MAG: hypothetical protein VB121_11340, partial [Enterococcus thailandicus]|nr:hypothetical protein [Enterococcus thailandicus]
NYLRYTVSNPANSNNNYDEIETVCWWSKFVSTSQKIKNFKVGRLEYNYFNLESYLVKQVSSSLKAYIEANNGSIDELMKIIHDAKLSKKQKEMLCQLRVTHD